MFKIRELITSSWEFDESDIDLENKFQMINIAIVLSSISLIFGIIVNIYKNLYAIIPLETSLLGVNIILFFVLRRCKKAFKIVAFIETAQFTLLFLFLLYAYPPESLKFIWIFTYPVILLYFQDEKYVRYWMGIILTFILIAPLQAYYEVYFSEFQVIYLSFVLLIVSAIVFFYQRKMEDAKSLILKQQEMLKATVDELQQKDNLLSIQSKQAVMGEMISMIAHQWRQPLSSVTLSISNIQVKKLLGYDLEEDKILDTLQDISDTVVYLSDTIDDFQTYFNPNKEVNRISIHEVIHKAIAFVKPRVDAAKIKLEFLYAEDEIIETYASEFIQVLLNIINNAIDELEKMDKEELTISIELINQRDFYILNIIDNAGGISKENLSLVFDPYFSTKGKNGTGLGLYMSQMIMQKQFNSKIEVTSSKDGSKFYMRVPKILS